MGLSLSLSDERTSLSFSIAADPRQRSHSRVRVPLDSRPYFTVSDTLVQLLPCLSFSLMSARINFSLAAQLLLSQSQQSDLGRHHLRLSNVLERILNLVVNRFTRQTLHTVNRKHLFVNILCVKSFCPQKRTTELCSSVVYSSNTVVILIIYLA
jgi:hypothetical protein